MPRLTDDTLPRLRRLTVGGLLGPLAGSTPPARGLVRFLASRGTTGGVRDQGRPRDYMAVLSRLKDEAQYRRREVRPVRRVHLIADLRDQYESTDRRLTDAVRLVAGLFLTLPDCRLTLTAWGVRGRQYPFQSLAGEGHWPWLNKLTIAMQSLDTDPRASAGALRQAAGTDEPAHVVLVTGWVEPAQVRDLNFQFGGTCVLVDPPAGVLTAGRVGANDPTLSLLPSAAADEWDAERRAELARACVARRMGLVVLAGHGRLIDRLEEQFTSTRSAAE